MTRIPPKPIGGQVIFLLTLPYRGFWMVYYPYCGEENIVDAQYCQNCGNEIPKKEGLTWQMFGMLLFK